MSKKLLFLKKDFLKFMIQINPSSDTNQTLILHTLLLETGREDGIMINQEDIVKLTDLNKSTVSTILNNMTTFQKHLEVFEKRIEKKKYYNCLLTYQEYIENIFKFALKTAESNIEFIPKLIYRLNKLTAKDNNERDEIDFTKEYLIYYFISSNIYKAFTDNYTIKIEKFLVCQKTREKAVDQVIRAIHFENEASEENDSLLKIRREFLYNMVEFSESVGGKVEILFLFLAIFITKNPITQENIQELTQLSKGNISESLKLILQLKLIKISKIPKDRKKYYSAAMSLEEYGFYKLVIYKQRGEKLQTSITSKFIPQIQSLEIDDPKEKNRLIREMNELKTAFLMFTNYLEEFFREYKIIEKEVLKEKKISYKQI